MSDARVVLLRRSFLAGLGLAIGGLALGSVAEAQPTSAAQGDKPATAPAVKLFVQIAPDGTVKIVCHRSEMGQGVRSTLPALIADEMGADLGRVQVVQADGDKAYGDQNTDGSHSIRGNYDELRRIGAAARVMLIGAAATKWGVSPSACEARGHKVTGPGGREAGFGALAEAAAKQPVPTSITLKPKEQLRTRGKVLPLIDGPDIVTGKAVFGADVRLPGMLTAVIARPPVVGGRVQRHDASKTLAIPGVRMVYELPAAAAPFGFKPVGGVAVIADNTWAAIRGRAALEITWEHGENAAYDSASYREELIRALDGGPSKVVRKTGDVAQALGAATKRIEAEYHTPHLAHASMEPPAAVAHFKEGRCEVWTSTQNPQAARSTTAQALGIDEAQVTVHVTLLGGGFGRKSKPDYVAEAALVSRAAKAPVRLQWTREDDVQHDYYHTTSAQRFIAGLDASNQVVAWHHRDTFPPIGSTFTGATFASDGDLQQGVLDLPLAVPNVLVENCAAKAMTRIGWLRSVANIYHAFAAQSFIDELAAARDRDPLDNAIELIGPARVLTPEALGVESLPNYQQSLDEHPIDTARHLRVLKRVAELSRWRQRKEERRALGLAVHRSFLTYVAVVVSVVRDAQGRVRVDEAWIVADAGTIANIDRVRYQLEGGVIFGLGLALYGEITMNKGATVESNFHDYKLMRLAQAPRNIHVEVIESDGPPGGIGEPGVPPVAPALANAIFALTGTRVRNLPIARTIPVA